MQRKILSLIVCFFVASVFFNSSALAFTWFGLRNNDSEVFFVNSNNHTPPSPPPKHHHKHKPKPPKHKHDKKHHEHKCWFWRCK